VGVPGALVALAEELQRACLERGLTVALAESCTGGLVAAAITEVPGSSGYFLGGVVSYSNEAKVALLGVPEELLAVHGAVSPEVAGAMAAGARARFGADLAVGVTGVAGPDGGSAEKPVGLVHLGIARPGEVGTMVQRFDGDRPAIREAAAFRALALLHAYAIEATSR
jgi:nicotinamide-nucleotide amidase